MIFLGTGHKSFKNHGLASDAVHFSTLEARVNEIPLQTEGLEDIIAAIVHQKKDSPEWNKIVAPYTGIFSHFAKECKRLNLFNWLPAPKLKANIIENIYPMHPLATYALLQLAGEAGSDNRSVFKFFSPEFETGETGWINVQEFSYPWFTERNDIEADGKLNLYTEDLLYDYFRDSLKTDNRNLRDRVRKAVADYEETLKEMLAYLKKDSQMKLFDEVDELMHKILKAMLINEIISTESTPVHNTLENIKFALNALSVQDAQALEERLKRLCQATILYNNKGIYEFKRSDVVDIERRIQEFKINPENRPSNILHTFLEHLPFTGEEEYLEAKHYNTTYNEDKRLKVQFVLPSEIEQDYIIDGQTASFFEMLEHKRRQIEDPRMSYEGTAVYVFCETDKDIDLAKKYIIKNTQDKIVISVPQKALPVLEDVLTLDAIKSIQQSDDTLARMKHNAESEKKL